MPEQTAQFKFKGFIIKKSLIEINADIEQSFNIEFNQASIIEDDGIYMQHEISVDITTENNSVKISVDAIGFFEFDKSLTDEQKRAFETINAPAILFPYIRAYITTLSSLSGINPPIILPTINLSKRDD